MTAAAVTPYRLTQEWKEAVQDAKERGAAAAQAYVKRVGIPTPLDFRYAVQVAGQRAQDAVVTYSISFDGEAVIELELICAESYIHELLSLWQERE